MEYIPSQIDLAWARNTMMLLKEEGLLAFPGTQLVYKVSHDNMTMVLLNPKQLADPESYEIHQKTIVVFEMIGYTVTEKADA